MDTERLAAARTQFEDDGFYLHQEPLVPDDLIRRATEGMDALRSGDYDTGEPPRGGWQPGDDPQRLCKIEMPQIANRAILELVSHPAIGELAAASSGARMVQVWWVQLLGKPPADPQGQVPTNIGWHHRGRRAANCARRGSRSVMSPPNPDPCGSCVDRTGGGSWTRVTSIPRTS